MVIGVIAGGYTALVKSSEGAEDDVNAGMAAMDQTRVAAADFVLGIAASGTTPYVRGALSRAQTIGATTGLVSCSDPPRVLVETCDVLILPKVGPEALTGSTRLKAGTATKLVLNTISSGAMIRLGRAYGNLMVDLMAMSDKLRDRGERIVMECSGVDRVTARRIWRCCRLSGGSAWPARCCSSWRTRRSRRGIFHSSRRTDRRSGTSPVGPRCSSATPRWWPNASACAW